MTNSRAVSIRSLPFMVCALLLLSCQNQHENAATRRLDATEKIRYQQYMVQGQQLYAQHCSNCHQEDGQGLGRLIPPLAQSDYLLADVDRTFCIIKYGLKGPVVVNGETYQQAMPANETLKDIEIAQIATYIYNSWGHEKGYISVRQVSKQLDQCQP